MAPGAAPPAPGGAGEASSDNWQTTRIVPDDFISAVEFIKQFEPRRVESTRRAGREVRPLAERPVAFTVFHAVTKKGEDCYLFEVNKDWWRLNLIGGKREESDHRDFSVTAVREICEELGLSPDFSLEVVTHEAGLNWRQRPPSCSAGTKTTGALQD